MTQPDTKPYRLKGRIWIEGDQGTFIGYGRAVLLERIRDYGSISAAARSMKMSYRHAWKLVNAMNLQSRSLVVKSSTGGRGGGGAEVTEVGAHAIEVFWAVYRDYQDFLETRSRQMDL